MELLKKHFTLYELKSIVKTFVSSLIVDGGAAVAFNTVIGGNWSTVALLALANCLVRSLLKAVVAVVFTKPQQLNG